MNESIDQLVEQVPELNLRKRTDTRTIHWSDVRENKALREGDVIQIISYVDDSGRQWTRADIMCYIKLNEAFDNPIDQLIADSELELVH
jgi:hypothetical protein